MEEVLANAWKAHFGSARDRITLWEETLPEAIQQQGSSPNTHICLIFSSPAPPYLLLFSSFSSPPPHPSPPAKHTDLTTEHSQELANLIMATLPPEGYTHTPEKQAVLYFLSTALPSLPALTKLLASAIVKITSSIPLPPSHYPPTSAATLLNWTAFVLGNLESGEATQKASEKLLQSMEKFLQVAVTSGYANPGVHASRWASVQRAVVTALSSRPDLRENVVVEGMVKSGSCSPPLMLAIFQYMKNRSNGDDSNAINSEISNALLTVYSDKVIGAKEPSPLYVYQCYAPIVGEASPAQVKSIILPAVVRMIKRSPEQALASTLETLKALSPGSIYHKSISGGSGEGGGGGGGVVGELGPLLLQQTRHAKAAVRTLAIACAAELAHKAALCLTKHHHTSIEVAAAEVVEEQVSAAVKAAVAVLQGTSDVGKLKSVQDKVSTTKYIAAWAASCSNSVSRKEVDELVVYVVEAMCKQYKEEGTDDGKIALIDDALTNWVVMGIDVGNKGQQQHVPEAVVHQLAAGLSEKEPVRRAHLRAAAKITSSAIGKTSNSASPNYAPLAVPLGKLINEGVAKAAARGEAIWALLITACIAAVDTTFIEQQQAVKSEEWKTALAGGSPLISTATAAVLTPEDGVAAAELFGVLLLHHSSSSLGLGSGAATMNEVADSLVLMLVHYSSDVRRAAVTITSKLAATNDDSNNNAPSTALLALTESLKAAVDKAKDIAVLQDPAAVLAEAPASLHAIQQRFLAALTAMTPPITLHTSTTTDTGTFIKNSNTLQYKNVDIKVIVNILLLAHHPIIAGVKGHSNSGRKAWSAISSRLASSSFSKSRSTLRVRKEVVVRGLLERLGASTVASKIGKCLVESVEKGWGEIFSGLYNFSGTNQHRHRHSARSQCIAACGALRSLSSTVATASTIDNSTNSTTMQQALLSGLLEALHPLLDSRTAHDALTPRELRIFYTAEGRLSTENDDGSIIPAEMLEVVLADTAYQPASVASVLRPLAATATGTDNSKANGSASRPSASGGRGGGGKPSSGGKDAVAEARIKQLAAEKQVRTRVLYIKQQLTWGLDALVSLAEGNRTFAMENLETFSSYILPLLSSPLASEDPAFCALHRLAAAALPGALGNKAFDISCALRLISLVEQSAAKAPPSIPGQQYQSIVGSDKSCMKRAIAALQIATGGRPGSEDSLPVPGTTPLPGPIYVFCFPILKAVLSCPQPTPLHESSLGVLSLHVGPSSVDPAALPASFDLLYHVLEVLPVYLGRVQPLLSGLCSGLDGGEKTMAGLLAGLRGVVSGAPHVRSAALEALFYAPIVSNKAFTTIGGGERDMTRALSMLWMAQYDGEEINAETAKELWKEAGAVLPAGFAPPLLECLNSPHRGVREAAAAALASGCSEKLYPAAASEALSTMIDVDVYKGRSPVGRSGTASGLSHLATRFGTGTTSSTGSDLSAALNFLLQAGLADHHDTVRAEMIDAGVKIVDYHSSKDAASAATMLPMFEGALEGRPTGSHLSEADYDHVRRGAVVFLGTLAAHLDPHNPKVKSIIGTLIEVLKTPSESVQRAVSDRLPPLMQTLSKNTTDSGDFIKATVDSLLEQCLRGASYGDRKGAAYGLAGAVKGLGISSLKAYGIMDALKGMLEESSNGSSSSKKKNDTVEIAAREGALCALECLSDKLGRLFEPYVISVLPMLLSAFGDPIPEVRSAAEAAARVIMAQLTGQGVKLVLPALLQGVEDKLWRTKHGSIQLLGAMAHCNPKQLSACLPSIVPTLGEVLSDPHPKVSAAAEEALQHVGSVVRNPEIARLAPYLLAAIADPSKNTKKCLDKLLSTVFVNTIDAASLALVAPVVHRGLRDRSGDVKKKAARIVGNLGVLINEPKDIAPYIAMLLPELQTALVDPLPEVRGTSARALGSLVKGMGEAHFKELLPWLLERLRSEGSAVERSGAAQGLAEVLAVQGPEAVAELLPDILTGCRARNAPMREGHLTLFTFLPHSMKNADFKPMLPQVLPCVLDGLADESEGVRDAALSAGRVAVDLYAGTALPMLLPAVERGMQSANWRIRQSSVELLGDLLYKVSGATGRIQQDLSNDEEEGISVEATGAAIMQALGVTKRNDVLARLYLARSDIAYSVRTAALHVWKTVVTNTPRTLGEVLPSLMTLVIRSLAAADEDSRVTAGKCLGELVKKMGERILGQIIPILIKESQASNSTPATRQGVCLGLKEVLENCTRTQLAEHLTEMLPAIQSALCDEDDLVRQAAGGVFAVLFKGGGGGAIDTVIPALLSSLEANDPGTAEGEAALEGLRVVLGVKPQLLGSMIPRLLKPPHIAGNLKALGALSQVAGAAIHPYLPTVIPPLLQIASDNNNAEQQHGHQEAAQSALEAVALSVGEDGSYVLVGQLIRGLEEAKSRLGAANTITAFCKGTKLDFQEHIPTLITALVPLLAEEDGDGADDDDKEQQQQQQDVLLACWTALNALTATIPKELAPSFVRCLKDGVLAARERRRRILKERQHQHILTSSMFVLPGLCTPPKGLAPFLPVYFQGVLQATSPELRELAADALGDLVESTTEEALKPFVVQITGPLIRIIGDKFPWEIKAAILRTMGLLISRGGIGLKPFVPQLQTTFVKCLPDPAAKVRHLAAVNLGALTKLSLRLDQVVCDLANAAKTADAQVQGAYLEAVRGALLVSGDRMSGETLGKIQSALEEVITGAGDSEAVRVEAAAVTGALAQRVLEDAVFVDLLTSAATGGPLSPIATTSTNRAERIGAAATAAYVAQYAAGRLKPAGQLQLLIAVIKKMARDENVDVKLSASKAAGRIITHEINSTTENNKNFSESLPSLIPVFVMLLGPDQHSDTRKHVLAVIRKITTTAPPRGAQCLEPHFADLVPSICGVIQDSAGPAKLSAERTIARVLRLVDDSDVATAFFASKGAGAMVKAMMTEAYVRRLTKGLAAVMQGEEEDEGYDV